MGILNVTPDSFFDGGKYNTVEKAVSRAMELQELGADILDIGGESTRPGSDPVPLEEELKRVIPVLEKLEGKLSIPISIDTRKPKVAKEALECGASIINDVEGFRNPEMRKVAIEYQAGVCVMHMKGTPKTMQKSPFYEDVLGEVSEFLQKRAHLLEEEGLNRECIAIDPGIGFGKRLEDNLILLHSTRELASLGYPLLIGASRKSFIAQIAGDETTRLAGTIVSHLYCVLHGASIIRVHDVAEMREALEVWWAIERASPKKRQFLSK